jgi:WS/DGAT/MGAT family acyltransferase
LTSERVVIDRLTAGDELMLRASARWPQDNCALVLLDEGDLLDPAGRLRIEAARARIESRLHLAPRLRKVIRVPPRTLGGPVWVDAQTFDLSEHVHELPLAAPAGDAELIAAAELLRRRRLDPSRPPWAMWFITGLPERQIGLFVKMHHAIADGMAAIATIGVFLDTDPDSLPGKARPWAPSRLPSVRELRDDNRRRRIGRLAATLSKFRSLPTSMRRLSGAWPAVRELVAEPPGPETSLDRLIGPDRSLALVRSHIDTVKEVARHYEATVNDVLLAITAGGLRALLRSRGEPIEGLNLRIYVPMSLRRDGDDTLDGNRVAQMVVPVQLGVSDPGERLRQIAAETAHRKARNRPSLGALFGSGILTGGILTQLMLRAIQRQRVNVTTANLHGPEFPLYFSGARILEVFPVVPLIGSVTLGVGALSYAGSFNVGLVADRDTFPDLDVFAEAVRSELSALATRTPHARPAANTGSARG